MLGLGVFCGKYMTDTREEFPEAWFADAKLAPDRRDCSLNYFGVDASLPLSCGGQKAGFIPMTRAAGSNGIAGIIWAAACLKKTRDRSSDGEQYGGICGRYNDTVPQAISAAAVANAKPYCIGLTTAG